MKKPKNKNKKGQLSVGPDKPLGPHKPDIKINTVNMYVQNITVVQGPPPMPPEKRKFIEKCVALTFGVLFVGALLVLAVLIPTPTPDQRLTFRIIMAIAAAGFVAMTPGFLEVNVSKWIRGGGALGVFLMVFFYNPAVTPP